MPTEGQAPFNSAIALLTRLDRILQKIQDVAINPQRIIAQYQKYQLVKEYYVQASPLIKAEDKELIKSTVNKLKLRKDEEDLAYSYELDDELNEFLVLIQESLQSNGLFMPSGKEKKL